jgi:hypothetical protein
MTDFLVGATAGQASSGTQTIIPLCHMPAKRTELLRIDITGELAHYVHTGDMEAIYAESFTAFFVKFMLTRSNVSV